MNPRVSFHIIGGFIKFLGLLLILPAICSLAYRDGDLYVFLVTAFITSLTGFIIEKATKGSGKVVEIGRKDAFFIAFMCWITASLFGAIPYLLIGVVESPFDAIFESVSGFTTTGASVLSDVEDLPHGILYYRSFTQWLGGMGIVVLSIAILPKLSVGGMQLMSLEAPGPTPEKLTPHIASTAKHLWYVYLSVSLAEIALLFVCGMPLYDSITTTFSTVSTGGFSVKNASIGAYGSPLIESVVMVFMVFGGMNFLLIYYMFLRKFRRPVQNTELKYYLVILLFFILFITFDLWDGYYASFAESLRYASFQVISIITTTGFSTTDFNQWSKFALYILLMLMFLGGCSGSTSGSVKIIRIVILIKKSIREVNHLIKPHAVLPLRIDKEAVKEDTVSGVTSFFILYIALFAVSVPVILAIEDLSFTGAVSTCATMIGNVGPGFDEVGPTHNYGFLTGFSKLWLCLLMLLGRLELYTILVFLVPLYWKK